MVEKKSISSGEKSECNIHPVVAAESLTMTVTRWKDVANLEIPASIASVQNGGLVVCTSCHLPELLLQNCAFVCGNSSCVNRLPRRGPAHLGDDQEGVDPNNSHCYCGVASRRRKNKHGFERVECAALRCEYQGEGERHTRKLNIHFPEIDWVARFTNKAGRAGGQNLSAETTHPMKRIDSSGSLFPNYGRATGQATPGTTTPKESRSRSSSVTFSQATLTITRNADREPPNQGIQTSASID
ncbi:hypothetical protein AC579_4627 [Pseudocercospora musae]|uniref:Uncharacterized protein n=1 Tax=Pseudocercospora musae TaxID=113226 RepID=A0A139HK44_9PEZI|nr:hypothetical protein AC579_4627 [Pseudocercospora musae]